MSDYLRSCRHTVKIFIELLNLKAALIAGVTSIHRRISIKFLPFNFKQKKRYSELLKMSLKISGLSNGRRGERAYSFFFFFFQEFSDHVETIF